MTAQAQTGPNVSVPQFIKRRSRNRPRYAPLEHESLTVCLGHEPFRRSHRTLHTDQNVVDDVRLDAELTVGEQLN